ncbi:unnamed protein product [Chrysoparadoxa australica]
MGSSKKPYCIGGLVVLVLAAVAAGLGVYFTREEIEDVPTTVESESIIRDVQAGMLTGANIAGTATIQSVRAMVDSTPMYQLKLTGFDVTDGTCTAGDSLIAEFDDVQVDLGMESLMGDAVIDISAQVPTFDPALYDGFSITCGDGSTDVGGITWDEEMMMSIPQEEIVLQGEFQSLSTYTCEGRMFIIKETTMVDGVATESFMARFEEVNSSPGPDVKLFLTTEEDPRSPGNDALLVLIDDTRSGLFTKTGNFNQALPDDFDPSLYAAAIVYCERFSVIWGNLPSFVTPP